MKKSNLTGYLLFISVFSFLTTFIYIVQKSYDNLMEPAAAVKQSVIIKPLDPTLKISVLDEIEKRNYYNDEIPVSPTAVPPKPKK